MKGTQKRKYIHAVQLTTSNKTLPGGVCKSPLYWKSKIRGRRGVVSCLFFTPFPRTPASGHRDSGMSRSQGETSTPRFSPNSEWLHVALCKTPALHLSMAKFSSSNIFELFLGKYPKSCGIDF